MVQIEATFTLKSVWFMLIGLAAKNAILIVEFAKEEFRKKANRSPMLLWKARASASVPFL